jgi:hypothetical protein
MASMNDRKDKRDSPPDGERRSDRRSQDTPRWRPDDEVPANRREDSERRDRDNEQEHPDRRGS